VPAIGEGQVAFRGAGIHGIGVACFELIWMVDGVAAPQSG
jgi:hypothetical protein